MKKSNKQKEVIIMAESHVQLKREEVVGDEVILTDISPSTNTESVVDLSTGLTLDEDLLRLWNAINNKLYRVVNSVNGRTGVVVLSAKDVGLDNVDNVSFADIQEWVLEQIEKLFGSHSFKLYESMDSVLIDISANDKMMSGTGFFASEGFSAENDKLAYIGYFYWDEGNKHHSYDMRPVNIIGETDSSIIYNEKIGEKDYRGGKLGINIWPYEDALEVYEGLSNVPGEPKANSGLRIIKSKLVPDVLLIDGVYGSDFERPGDSEDAWLYAVPPSDTTDVVRVDIIYDGKKLTDPDMAYAKKVFKYHDIIVCHFASDYTDADDNLLEGVNKDLIGLHTAIGTVTAIDKKADETVVSYTVEFFSTKPIIGYGLKYRRTHSNKEADKQLNRLEINTPIGVVSTSYTGWENMNDFTVKNAIFADDISGLTMRANEKQRFSDDYSIPSHVQPLKHQFVNLPNGPTRVFHPTFDDNGNTNYAGLSITTDSSLSIIPAYTFLQQMTAGKYDGSMVAFNWRAEAEFFDASSLESPDSYGENSSGSLIGINLDKAVVNKYAHDVAGYIFGNLSGLRINPAKENVDFDVIGISDTSNVPKAYTTSKTSGGLAINVGKFLKIEPSEIQNDAANYYDGGKLTIKVGPGLGDDGNGNLSLYADPKSCLRVINPSDGDSYLDVKLRSTIVPAGNEEGLVDVEVNKSGLRNFTYNTDGEKEYGLSISLGKDSGLIIKNEPDPEYTGTDGPETVSTLNINHGNGLYVDKKGILGIKVTGKMFEGADDIRNGLIVDPILNMLKVYLDHTTCGLTFGDDGSITGDYETIRYSGNLKVAKTMSDGTVRYGYTDPFSVEYNPGTSSKNIVIGNGLRLVLDESEVPKEVNVSWPYDSLTNTEEGEQP